MQPYTQVKGEQVSNKEKGFSSCQMLQVLQIGTLCFNVLKYARRPENSLQETKKSCQKKMFWLLQNGTQNCNLPRQVKQTRKFRMVQPGSSGFEITTALQAKQKLQEGSRKIFGEESS